MSLDLSVSVSFQDDYTQKLLHVFQNRRKRDHLIW